MVGDVTDVVPVMVLGWSEVVTVYPMVIEGRSLVGGLIDNDFAPSWSQGISVVVEVALYLGIS